jgi:hypothetical protein
VGVVCGGEVDGGGEACAGVGLIVNTVTIGAGLWG